MDASLISSNNLVNSKAQLIRKQQNELTSLNKTFALFKSQKASNIDERLANLSKVQDDIKKTLENIEYCQTGDAGYDFFTARPTLTRGSPDFRGTKHFSKSFRKEPKVILALTAIDISNNANIRVHLAVTSIYTDRFDFRLHTWADSRVNRVNLHWMACPSS